MIAARVGSTTRGRLVALWREPVSRTGYLLAVNSVLTAVVGIGYWLVAARLYRPEVVGVNSAAISAMSFLAGIAQLNMMSALLRFVPGAARRARLMIAGAFAVAGALAGVAAVIFLVGLRVWAPNMSGLVSSTTGRLVFIVATIVWTVFVLQSSALVAVGRTGWVPILNGVFAVGKLALVVVCASVLASQGVWISWVAATAVVFVATMGYLFARAIPAFAAGPAVTELVPTGRDLVRYCGPDYVGWLAWMAVISVTPVLVFDLTDPRLAAVFNLIWQIGTGLYAVGAAFGQSQVANGSREPERVREHYRAAMRNSFALLIPAVVVLVAAAPLALIPFGSWYQHEGPTVLRLVALSAIPNTVVTLEVAYARVTREMRVVAVTLVALCVVVLAASVPLVPLMGLSGAGIAVLGGQSVVAAVAVMWRRARLKNSQQRSEVDLVSSSPAGAPRRSFMPIQRARGGISKEMLQPAISHIRARGWSVDRMLPTLSDTAVLMACRANQGGVLKVAVTDSGIEDLVREEALLQRMAAESVLGTWRHLLPEVLEATEFPGGRLLLLKRLPGEEPSSALGSCSSARWDLLTSNAVDAIRPLHELDATSGPVASDLLERMVDGPIDLLRSSLRASRWGAALDLLSMELRMEFKGRSMMTGWSHGDYYPGNVLVGPAGEVSAVLDWGQAEERDLPVLDLVHWLLSVPQANGERDYGTRVAQRLADVQGCWRPAEVAALRRVSLIDPLPERALLLLGWLRHVSGNVAKSTRYAASPIWVRRNVLPVLREVCSD